MSWEGRSVPRLRPPARPSRSVERAARTVFRSSRPAERASHRYEQVCFLVGGALCAATFSGSKPAGIPFTRLVTTFQVVSPRGAGLPQVQPEGFSRGAGRYSCRCGVGKPSLRHRASRCASLRSSRIISATSSRKLTSGSQPSCSRAFVGSPSRVSTSVGR